MFDRDFASFITLMDRAIRNPKAPSLFQVWDLDTGVVTWVNADLITDVVRSLDGLNVLGAGA